jgi:Mg/Co/Ni transporter MgtE
MSYILFSFVPLTKTSNMKYDYKMLEATDKEEAIVSILDAVKHNAVWLNKCQSYFSRTVIALNEELRKKFLDELSKDDIIDLFIEFKTEYYNYKDNTVWS